MNQVTDTAVARKQPACARSIISQPAFRWGILATMCALSISFGSVPQANASDGLLSDMDCIVEPSRLVDLGSAVPGLLAESYYDRTDFVSAGTLMARLESDVERVSLAIATEAASSTTAIALREETARFGDRTRVRNAELLKSASVSRQVMDQVSTEASIARLQVKQEEEAARLALLEVERARAVLERREIRTPISGSVTERYRFTGEFVDSEPVYQIAQLDPLHIEVIVPVDYLGQLETGTTAAVTLDVPGFRDQLLQAVVRRIDAVADAASGTYGVRLVLPNPDLSIPSGVRCRIDFFAS